MKINPLVGIYSVVFIRWTNVWKWEISVFGWMHFSYAKFYACLIFLASTIRRPKLCNFMIFLKIKFYLVESLRTVSLNNLYDDRFGLHWIRPWHVVFTIKTIVFIIAIHSGFALVSRDYKHYCLNRKQQMSCSVSFNTKAIMI